MAKEVAQPRSFEVLQQPFALFVILFTAALLPGAGLAQRQMAAVGGYRLEYLFEGASGPVVVFLNGGTAPMEYWDPVAAGLTGFARVLRYERAGHGRSEMGREPRHASNMAEELRALLATLGINEPVFLVAHSAGCPLGRVFSSRFPASVAGALLIEPGDREYLDAFGVLHLPDDEGRSWTNLWAATWNRLAQGGGGYAKEVQAKAATLGQLQESAVPPQLPLIIVSALDSSRPDWFLRGSSLESVQEFYRQKVAYHRALARSSSRGWQVSAVDATHVVQEDRPELIAALFLELIEMALSHDSVG